MMGLVPQNFHLNPDFILHKEDKLFIAFKLLK